MHPPASDIDAGAHFALSPYVGALRLSPSHLIVLHVLGRRRVIGGERLVAEVARFRCPTEVDPTSASKEFQALRLASVLQPVGNDETAWIKLAYARARRLARTEPFPSFLAPLCEVRNDAPCEADAIVGVRHAASESLAGIALDEGEHLVTHPAGTPTHLASDLWETLQSFRGGRPVGRADRHVAQFLMSRGLIWPSPEAEHNACLQAFALAAERLPELEITNRPGDLFRQIHRPNAVRDVDRPTVRKRIALVGPCLSQQFSECLEHHALRLGWSIETAAMLEPGPQLAHRQLDLVVLSAGQFVAHLVHFAGLGRWDDCEVLVERIVDAVRSRVVQTRELTNAPIAVAAARPPALGVFWPGSPEAYRLESMFARVNLELARATLAVGKAYMVDELDARERLMPGIYWDDRYNCAAHRAPLSSWNWVVLKPGRTDEPPPREADGLAPPARADQSDPAGASSLAVLELMVRLARRRRVDTVVFEPRGLLWPARRRPDDLERAGQRNFLVDVEDYWFAGVAEALSAVARRGIRLICLTGEDPADVNRGVAATAGTDTLLSREALAEIHCTLGKDEFIDDLLKRDREPGACVLWIDFTLADARARDGLVVLPQTARWQLRELLLRAAELAPALAGLDLSGDRASAPAAEELQDEVGLRQRVREAIRLSLAAEAQCAPEAVERVEDLADVGLDSLSATRVLMSVEERLGTRIDSWERIGARLYEVRTLEEVFLAALRGAAQAN